MRITIDRMDNGIAVLDVGGEMIDFPVAALPEGAKEGDVLSFVKVDASEIIKDAQNRINRMRSASQSNAGDSFDI
ncbi:MAG: DUF3006 domain-containing protein [Proteobacteria bacterium]|jgi:hypothetical protein|nr:DUF3006 domain-containing protein [Pseudomonadota bacterium]